MIPAGSRAHDGARAPDAISTFLGSVPAEERERREKLSSYRNAATAFVARTESDTARLLAWEVVNWATPFVYAPGVSLDWLDRLNQLSKRLMLTALQAEEMDDILREASHG
jgi:hypothetical protein